MVRSMSKLTKDAQPTLFHHMLATLAKDDRLLRLYTQNVDGIDTGLEPLATTVPLKKNEGKWPKTIQLHGGLDKMVCAKCHAISDFDADLFDGPTPPVCNACVALDKVRTDMAGKRSHGIGRLRPRMVLYNEHNPDDEAIGNVVADDLRKRPDAIIVVGTSMKIPGVRRIVREMCATVRDRRDGMAIWINNDPEPVGAEFKDCWDIVVKGKCDEVARHAALGRWDQMDASVEFTQEAWDEVIKTEPQIVINPTFKPLDSKQPLRRASNSPEFTPIAQRVSTEVYDGTSQNDSLINGAPPTPSKSARSTPAKPKVSAFDAMKEKKPAAKRGVGRPKKNPAPAATKAKTAKAAAPKITLKINQTMKQSKSFAASTTTGKPSKLQEKAGLKRSRSKIEANEAAMKPLSPENVRVNSISSASPEAMLGEEAEMGKDQPVRKRMSIERILM